MTGFSGQSIEPMGVGPVTCPSGLVGEYCPFVSPYTWLLKRRIVMLTLRRSAWRKWLPPIERASPSPETTHTDRSWREAARPVAIAAARPWIECRP